MKTILSSTLSLLYAVMLIAQTPPPLSPNTYKNGKQHGEWIIWYDKDWKETKIQDSVVYYRKITLDEGKPIGKVYDYYLNGQKQWEGQLSSINPDVKDGYSISFHKNGNIATTIVYANGQCHGIWNLHDENGILRIKGYFKNSHEIGEWKYYDKNSKLIKVIDYGRINEWEELDREYNSKIFNDNLDIALRMYNLSLKIFEDDDYRKYESIFNLARVYGYKSSYSKQIELYKQLLPIAKEVYGEKSSFYNDIYLHISFSYQNLAQYSNALEYLNSYLKQLRTISDENEKYFLYLQKKAEYLSFLERFTEAKKVYHDILNFYKQNKNYDSYINNLIKYGENEMLIGNYKKSLKTFIKVEILANQHLSNYHYNKAQNQINLSLNYYFLNDYAESLKFLNNAIELFKKNNYIINYSVKYSLAKLYGLHHEYTKSSTLLMSMLDELKRENYYPIIFYDALLLKSQNDFILNTKNNTDFKDIKRQFYFSISRYISEGFIIDNSYKDFYEFKLILNTYLNFNLWLITEQKNGFYFIKNSLKGLQLFASNSIKQKLQNNVNPEIREHYQHLVGLQQQQKALNENAEDYALQYKGLEELIENERIWLSNRSEEFKINFTPPTLELIQSHLSADEVFIDYYLIGNDYYGAMLQSSGDVLWKKIILDDDLVAAIKNAADKDQINELYNSVELYNSLILPFEDKLKNNKLVVSPDGLLHQVAFHAILTPTQQTLSTQYDLRTITSSRSLYVQEQPLELNAHLYGGIDFGDGLVQQTTLEENNDFMMTLLRGGSLEEFSPLVNTSQEIDDIAAILPQSNTKIFSGNQATEEQFREMNGQAPAILHLSTHGFYLPLEKEPSMEKKGDLTVKLFNQKKSNYSLKEDPMYRSGIALANANDTWLGRKALAEDNNGIMLAHEITQLDLSNTKLVVLSACQTALGDITNGEGVFGLQRAFKQAGVDYIVASLWEVPDADTKDLMVSFFKHLKQTKNPNTAMNLARIDMKNQNKTPYAYAGFVVLR